MSSYRGGDHSNEFPRKLQNEIASPLLSAPNANRRRRGCRARSSAPLSVLRLPHACHRDLRAWRDAVPRANANRDQDRHVMSTDRMPTLDCDRQPRWRPAGSAPACTGRPERPANTPRPASTMTAATPSSPRSAPCPFSRRASRTLPPTTIGTRARGKSP
jgi:hypothetical protein